MSSYNSFPLSEANPTTFFTGTSISPPAMPLCAAYFNSEVISTPVSLLAQSSFPPFDESIPLSSVDCTPPLLTTTMNVSNASVSVPLFSGETAASSGSSSHLQNIHPLYVTQPSGLSSLTPSHFVPYFPDLMVSHHNPHAGSPHQFAQVVYSQCNSEAWGTVASSSISQHPQQKGGPVIAHSYDPHLTPSYPHLYDSAYYWNTSQPDFHSYVPPFHTSNLAAAQDQSKDIQHQDFVSPQHMSSDQFPTLTVNHGKDFHAEEWSNDNGQVERSISRDGKSANMHFGLDDLDRIYHQQGHITEDPAWWWMYSAVADSKAFTDVQCNPGLCYGKGHTHSSSLGETHLAKTQPTFSLKQAASVLADMLAKPDLTECNSNVSGTEIQRPYSGSSLKGSGDITEHNEDPALGDTLSSSRSQSFSVHVASSEQFSQPEDLATTSCWPSKCDFGILSDMMKAKLRSDSMKQEVSKTSLSKTQEISGSFPAFMEDRPVVAGSHDNLPLLDMDREVGTGNEKHAVIHQGLSDSGMPKVRHESAKLSAFPFHQVNTVNENEIATGAIRNFFAEDKACTNVGYVTSEEAPELRSTKLNNVQIEQGVNRIEDCFKKNQSVSESSKDLEHGPFEARPFAGHVDPSNDGCKAKPSVFTCHNETDQRPQGSIPSSMSTKEFHSDDTKTVKRDAINKNGFAPYRVSDMCTENPLPYSKQCHSPDHKAQYSTTQAAEASSFRLVSDSIFNLSEVLLAHSQSNTCNGADSSDLRNLQLSIRNLSQYLLFERGNIAPQNFASSSNLCGKQGTVQDESSSDGTKEASHSRGEGEAINRCCGKSYDPFANTCLEPKVPLQRNPCDNWGIARQCCLADPNQIEIYNSEIPHELMDAGLAMKEEGNGAAEIKLDSKEGIAFHDLGAASQKLGADYEAQLQRMKALLDSVKRNNRKGDVAESNIADISHSAHQPKLMETGFSCKDKKVEANKELGFLCETLSWDDLQNFNLGLRAEFEKLQGLLGSFSRQLSHEQWKDTVNSRELNWWMNDHMPRTTKETQKADGISSTELRNMNEAELEEEFGIAGRQADAISEINLVSEPDSKVYEGGQLDDILVRVNSLSQHRPVGFEDGTLQSFDQDENISVHSKHDESDAYPSDHLVSASRFEDCELPFEGRHVLDLKGAGQCSPRVFQYPKPEKPVMETPVYPDTKQVELRLALLKARPGWYDVCGDSRITVNTEDESVPTELSSHTLNEPRTLRIKENYLGNPQEPSSEPNPLVEFGGTSKQDYYLVEGIVRERGEKEETVHKFNFSPHSKASKASFSHSRHNFNGQVDKEEIIYKPEHSFASPSELEDAGWEKVQVAFLDKKS